MGFPADPAEPTCTLLNRAVANRVLSWLVTARPTYHIRSHCHRLRIEPIPAHTIHGCVQFKAISSSNEFQPVIQLVIPRSIGGRARKDWPVLNPDGFMGILATIVFFDRSVRSWRTINPAIAW